jgi:hypothetical protein
VGSILLQSALSVVIVFTHPVRAILENVGAILVLFSALVAVGLFWRALSPAGRPRPGPAALAAAAVYVLASGWMFWFAFRGATHLLAWIGVIAAVGLGAYAASRRGAAAAARATGG